MDDSVPLRCSSRLTFAIAIFRLGGLDVLSLAHRLVVDNIQAGIVVVDPAERVLGINPFAPELCARGAGDGMPLARARRPVRACHSSTARSTRCDRRPAAPSVVARQRERRGQRRRRPPGHALMLLASRTASRWSRRCVAEATTDPLTGVANRRRFFALAEPAAQRASKDVAVQQAALIERHRSLRRAVGGLWSPSSDEVLRAVAQTVEPRYATSMFSVVMATRSSSRCRRAFLT